jgi:branched-chain amino acid transport system substrate-binding protein
MDVPVSLSSTRRTLARRHFLRGAAAGFVTAGVPRLARASTSAPPIKIGAVLHLTGPWAVYGLEQKIGLEIFVRQVNARGGVIGRPVQLIVEDDGSRPPVSVEKARKLIAVDKADVLTGLMGAPNIVSIVQYVKEARKPFLSIGATTTAVVTPPNCYRYHIHINQIPAAMGAATMKIAPKFGDNAKWFFVGSDYEFGHGGVKTLRGYAEAVTKIKEVGTAFPPVGTKDFTPIASVIAGAKPDVIAIAVPGFDHGQLIKQIRLFGIKAHIHSLHLSTVDAETGGDATLGMTGATFFLHDNPKVPRAAEFTEAFHKESGRWPAGYAALAVTAMEMYAMAIEKLGRIDDEKIIDTISSITHRQSLLGVARVRACDHQLLSTIYAAEIIRHAKYGLSYKPLAEVSDAEGEKLLTPCQQTGCEPAMKPS